MLLYNYAVQKNPYKCYYKIMQDFLFFNVFLLNYPRNRIFFDVFIKKKMSFFVKVFLLVMIFIIK